MPTNPGTTNLVSWWSLDETSGTRVDSHGSNDLTDNNTTLFGTGKQGNAADFVATNSEYLSRADNADLSTGDIDWTFCAWVYADSIASNPMIAGKYDNGANAGREWFLRILSSGVTNAWWYTNATGTRTILNGPSVSASTWFFVALRHEAGGNIGLSVDGSVFTTAAAAGGNDGGHQFQIGQAAGVYFDGLIDEVCIYKRALSTDEIAFLYNSGAGVTYADVVGATGAPLLMQMMRLSHTGGFLP